MKTKTLVAILIAAIMVFSAEAGMPMHHPMHPIGRTMYRPHHRPAARPRPPAPKPAPRLPPKPVHPVHPHHSPFLPFWYYATIISHPAPVVGPVRQVEVWIDGHYETQLQPNGQSILVWVPGHFELQPVR